MPTITLTCRECGNDFEYDPQTFAALGFSELPKRCPTCLDKRQERPAEATVKPKGRRLIAEFPAVQVLLPAADFASWSAGGHRDKPCLRATFKGDDLDPGHKWDGRLDVYALAETLPSVARVRVMEVEHEAGHVRAEKRGSSVYGLAPHPVQHVEVEYPSTYQYMVLEPTDAEPAAALVLASVDFKTTLKGYGRQWHAALDASGALWAVEISSSARRTGRFGVYGAIAVVDDDHPVIGREWGDVKSHRRFTLSFPGGEDISEAA